MRQTLLFACFYALFQGVAFAQSTLEYRLAEGDVFTVEQQAEQQIVQSLEGASHTITNRVSGVLQFRVLKVRDSSYLLEFMFRDLIFQIESSLQGVLLDIHATEPEPADLQSQVFNAMLNVPIHMELSRRGKILDVRGGDSLVSRVVAEAGLKDSFSRTMMRKSLEQQYGSQALAQSYEQMTYFYPSRPVQVGDRWQNQFEGKLQARNSWQLDSLGTERAIIHGSATITMQVDEPESSMHLKGRQTTLVQTRVDSGFLREMRVESSAEGFSTTTQTGELEIPTTITSQVMYRLIDHKHVQ